jgi:hypothetical protein
MRVRGKGGSREDSGEEEPKNPGTKPVPGAPAKERQEKGLIPEGVSYGVASATWKTGDI